MLTHSSSLKDNGSPAVLMPCNLEQFEVNMREDLQRQNRIGVVKTRAAVEAMTEVVKVYCAQGVNHARELFRSLHTKNNGDKDEFFPVSWKTFLRRCPQSSSEGDKSDDFYSIREEDGKLLRRGKEVIAAEDYYSCTVQMVREEFGGIFESNVFKAMSTRYSMNIDVLEASLSLPMQSAKPESNELVPSASSMIKQPTAATTVSLARGNNNDNAISTVLCVPSIQSLVEGASSIPPHSTTFDLSTLKTPLVLNMNFSGECRNRIVNNTTTTNNVAHNNNPTLSNNNDPHWVQDIKHIRQQVDNIEASERKRPPTQPAGDFTTAAGQATNAAKNLVPDFEYSTPAPRYLRFETSHGATPVSQSLASGVHCQPRKLSDGEDVVVIAGHQFITQRNYIPSLFKALSNGASIDLQKAFSDCLSKDTSALSESLGIHIHAAKDIQDTLKNCSPDEMMKDIIQALLTRSQCIMTRPEILQQKNLANLLGEMKSGCYTHPVAFFGKTTSFVTAMMNAPSTSEAMILVVAEDVTSITKCACFLSCGGDNCFWNGTAAPALGYRVMHTVEVSLLSRDKDNSFKHDDDDVDDDSGEVLFELATLDVMSAAKPMGDIFQVLSECENIIKVVVGSSITENFTVIPLDTRLSSLLKNHQLTFTIQKAHVTLEQQEYFALSCSRLVFEACFFESEGSVLLGQEFAPDEAKKTSKMRIVFKACMPSLVKLSDACSNGWIQSLGLEDWDFKSSGLAFFQGLPAESDDFYLEQMGRDVALTIDNSKVLRGAQIHKLITGDEAMHRFVMNAHKSFKPSNHHESGDKVGKTSTLLTMPSSYQVQNNNDKVAVENLTPDLNGSKFSFGAHEAVNMSLVEVLEPVSSSAAVARARFRAGADSLSNKVDKANIPSTVGNDENVVQMLEHHFGVTIPITHQGNPCKRCVRILSGIYDKSEGKNQDPKFCCESHACLSESVD